METEGTAQEPAEEQEVNWFECYLCGLKEIYDAKGIKPKFTPYISFSEGDYVVRDPFSPAEKKQFFILGSDCYICKNPVCQSNDCSIFYKERYCQNCALKKKDALPKQLHAKIKSLH